MCAKPLVDGVTQGERQRAWPSLRRAARRPGTGSRRRCARGAVTSRRRLLLPGRPTRARAREESEGHAAVRSTRVLHLISTSCVRCTWRSRRPCRRATPRRLADGSPRPPASASVWHWVSSPRYADARNSASAKRSTPSANPLFISSTTCRRRTLPVMHQLSPSPPSRRGWPHARPRRLQETNAAPRRTRPRRA